MIRINHSTLTIIEPNEQLSCDICGKINKLLSELDVPIHKKMIHICDECLHYSNYVMCNYIEEN